MQQQIAIPNAPVHVKVALDNEFRRFLLSPITFDHLYTKLKSLFNLQYDFRIKFQDDENDWVLIMTDQELLYAAELSGSPLRLQVKLTTDVPAPIERGRGCAGRGRGACNRGGVRSREERLLTKSSRLSERIEQLEAKLSSPKITAERQRVIRWRLAKLQEKLAWVKSQNTNSAAQSQPTQPGSVSVPESVPVPDATVTQPVEEEKSSPRGGCHRGGYRGGWRRAMMEDGSDQPVRKGCKGCRPRIDPEIIANFHQCKANLQAARESGNAEEILSCQEAFRAAKAAKIEARNVLRAQQASTDDVQNA